MKVAGWSAAVVVSLLAAAITFAVGWQLPPEYDCGGNDSGGDSCRARPLSVDWDTVTWDLRPARIGCFEPNPDPGTPIVGPGDVCVSSGAGREVRRTYEQMRDDIGRRRLRTLLLAAAMLAVTPTAALILKLRRRVRPRTARAVA